MSEKGFVYAYRGAWTHPAFNNLREAAIWNFLYQNAFWQDGDRNFNDHTFHLKRGQIVVSVSFLAKGFGMTDKGVRVVIQKLEKLGMVGIQGANKGTIITICNYEKYQANQKTEGEQEGKQRANRGQTEGDNKKELRKEVIKEVIIGASSEAKKNKGSRLSPEWELSEDLGSFAEGMGMKRSEVLLEEEKFKDYWTSKAGASAVKMNWDSVWKNWVRNAIEYKSERKK